MAKAGSRGQHQDALLTIAGLAEITLKASGEAKGRILKLPSHDLILLSGYQDSYLLQTSLIEDSFMLLGNPVTIRSNKHFMGLLRLISDRIILAAIELKKKIFPGQAVKRVTYT